MNGLMKALGTMLGVHIQYAQQEARGDISRVFAGLLLFLVALLIFATALLLGHVALVMLIEQRTHLGLLRATAIVAAADALVGVALASVAVKRLRRPFLKETRSLVKQTAKSLVEL